AQPRLEPIEVPERDESALGQKWAEALLEERIPDERQRTEGDAVKAAVACDQARAAGGCARELHRRVDGLRAGAREERRIQPVGQTLRQRLGEHAGEGGVVDLNTIDEILGQRGLEHRTYVRMVVTQAREALARVEVQVRAPGGVVQVRAPRRR